MEITFNFKHMKYHLPQKGRFIVIAANISDSDEIEQLAGFGSMVWDGEDKSDFRMDRINSWWWAYYNPGPRNLDYKPWIEESNNE